MLVCLRLSKAYCLQIRWVPSGAVDDQHPIQNFTIRICQDRVEHAYRGVCQLHHGLLCIIEDLKSFDSRNLFKNLLQESFLRRVWEIFDTDGPIPRLSYPAEASLRSCEQSAEDGREQIIWRFTCGAL